MTTRTTSHRRLRLTLAGFASLAAGFSAEAQEALRASQAYQQTSQARSRRADENGYNNTRGGLSYSLGASAGLEYNDNVNLSQATQEEDLIVSAGISTGARWQITQYNSLGLDLSLRYLAYVNNPNFNRVEFGLSPGSDNNIGLSFLIKDVRVDIYDSFGVHSDAFRDASVSSQTEIVQFSNTLGASAAYEWANAQIRGGYSLQKSFFLDSQFENNDRFAHLFNLGFQYALGPAIFAGIESSASLSQYGSDTMNDSTIITVGPSLSWRVSDFLRFNVGGGPSFSSYSANNAGFKPASVTSYYFYASADHKLTDFINHNLSVNRGISPGLDSFSTETLSINYGINWNIIRNLTVRTGVFYDNGTSSRADGVAVATEEDFDRIGVSIDTGLSLNKHLSVGLGYRYTTRSSSAAASDYTQNQATLSASYRF